tara:strand:+ start:391 stop:618 length:228 start_codon:yes stop_codon:yes gene_type:complete
MLKYTTEELMGYMEIAKQVRGFASVDRSQFGVSMHMQGLWREVYDQAQTIPTELRGDDFAKKISPLEDALGISRD